MLFMIRAFVIFFFRIDLPNVAFMSVISQNMVHTKKGSQHGMIHVVVTVLAVTTYAVQSLDGVEPIAEGIYSIVAAEVGGVCLPDFFAVGVKNVRGGNNPHPG